MAPIAMRCRAKCSCCHSRQRSTTPPSLPGKMKILHHSHASCPCRGPEVHLTFQWFYEALSQEYHSPFVCRRVSVLPCGTQVMPKPVGCHCQIHWAWPGHGTKCRQSGCPLCIAQCSHNYHLHIDHSRKHILPVGWYLKLLGQKVFLNAFHSEYNQHKGSHKDHCRYR